MKNEKALLVLFAYIIGFNAAYIAYGLPQLDKERGHTIYAEEDPSMFEDVHEGQGASVIQARVTEEGLFVGPSDDLKLISAKTEDEQTAGDGFHKEIVLTTVSPNERYIYYCEKQLEAEATCKNFVYDYEKNLIYRVQKNNEQVLSSVSEVKAQWLSDGRLSLDGLLSKDASTPWLLD